MIKVKNNKLKIFIRALLTILIAFVVIAVSYVAYVFIDYYRLPDRLDIDIDNGAKIEKMEVDKTYSISTYNIGFGAYDQDFSFFMDGGESSWAKSEESDRACVEGAYNYVKDELKPDFTLWQEVDTDSTRSYHINQYKILKGIFKNYDSAFVQNYDSPFLFYPFNQPHGKNKSGIVTASSVDMKSVLRRKLPVSETVSRILDLDRCYSITKIPVENGKYLSVFNIHMSAYGGSEEVRQGQIAKFTKDFKKEYKAGNYVICGGDFNHDLKVQSKDENNKVYWAQYFPREELPKGFSFCIDGLSDEERENLHDTCRVADEPYEKGKTYVITVDGFIVSDNVECVSYENVDLQYKYSDHDPVYMEFKLKRSK